MYEEKEEEEVESSRIPQARAFLISHSVSYHSFHGQLVPTYSCILHYVLVYCVLCTVYSRLPCNQFQLQGVSLQPYSQFAIFHSRFYSTLVFFIILYILILFNLIFILLFITYNTKYKIIIPFH